MNKSSKLSIGIVLLFDIILVSTSIISIASKDWKIMVLSILTILSLKLPFIITYLANKKKIMLPVGFQFILVLFIFSAQYFGEIKEFYVKLWWWDLLLHVIFGAYLVITTLHLIHGVIKKGPETTKRRFILFKVLFAFSFTIALGTIWEMFEFLGDYLFNTNMVKGGLEDTATDLLVKILAAFITSVVYYYRNLNSDAFD